MGKIKEYIDSIKKQTWNSKIDDDSNCFINYLKKMGVTIGNNVLFVTPSSSTIDLTTPFLIEIGDNVCVSKGLSLFTHDYSSFVERLNTGEVLGGVDRVFIGSNVQIGVNVTILAGTTIDDNVIIAAGAVCKGHLESNYVYGGVPAKKIQTIPSFIEKRRQDQFRQAKVVALSYYEKYKQIPKKELFNSLHLFPLFSKIDDWPDTFWNGFGQKNSKEQIKTFYKTHTPMFEDYEHFLIAIGLK